jgi:hypothetical protein
MSKGTKTAIIFLFILVLLSLGLNGWLLWQWWSFQQQAQEVIADVESIAQEAVSQAITDLESFENSTLEFDIQVQQEFPIQVEIPFNQTMEVPIQTTIPISQEIQTTILLDPFQAGLNIPTDITVPVDLEVPIDLNIPVSVDRTIPISTTIPLDLNVPLAIKISETELAPYLEKLRTGLVSLEEGFSNLK